MYVLALFFLGAYLAGAVIAILANFGGLAKLFALAVPVNGLFLSFFGKGTVFFDIQVHSFIWWWLFGIGAACAAPTFMGGPFQLFVTVQDEAGDDHRVRVEQFRGALLELVQRAAAPEIANPGITLSEILDHLRYAKYATVKSELGALVRMGLIRKESEGSDEEHYLPVGEGATEAHSDDPQNANTTAARATMTRRQAMTQVPSKWTIDV